MAQNASKLRTRNFATVVYPESAPEGWLTTLQECKVPVFVSPLHDKDVNPTGEPKKAHYHVIVMYGSVKTPEQAREFFDTFGGVGCEPVKDLRGYSRYLCHLDNPEKAQYDMADVKAYGGANYRVVIGTMADKAQAIREMEDFIDANDITSFYELSKYARQEREDWHDCLINSGAYYIKEVIKSRTWFLHHQEEH